MAGSSTVEETGFACQDTFRISGLGSGQQIPTICGSNNGQHIYIDMGEDAGDTASLNFAFGAGANGNRVWEIKVSELFCRSVLRPPSGCLQYLIGSKGTLETFNFAGNNGHLINQNYGICIRQEQGFCCVQYYTCDVDNSFSLDTNGNLIAGMSLVDTQCSKDYINIEGSSSTGNLANVRNRYCGTVLSDNNFAVKASLPISDCTQPFIVRIRTDDLRDADATRLSRGVCLTYTQIACGQA